MDRRASKFLAACALAVVTQADRWVHIGGSDAYQDYLDMESIKRHGTTITAWTRRDFASKHRTAWNEVEVDCFAKRNTILAYVQDDAGTVSHNMVRPHRESAPIAPNSVEETIFQIVCR